MRHPHHLVLRRSLLAVGLATALGGSSAFADEATSGGGWDRQQPVASQAFLARVEQFRQARHGNVGATRGGGPSGPTLVVSNCADAGAGSLREAASLVTVDETTIDLTSLQCSTITLSSGAVQVPAFRVYLNGPGADALTIDANHASRVLDAEASVYIDSLTLANGKTSGFGGCVSAGESFAAKYSVIRDCEAGGTSVAVTYGGAVASESGASVFGSTISGNLVTAQEFAAGGAIASLGPVFVDYGSLVANNTATAVGTSSGGAGGDPVVGAAGGGIWSGARALVGDSSRITGNTAVSVDGFARGGGVMVAAQPSTPPLTASAPTGQTHTSRTGKYADVSVYLSTVDGNQAISINRTAAGGGIQAGDIVVTPTPLHGVDGALTLGSAPYLYGSATIQRSTVSGNSTQGAEAFGGGISAFGRLYSGYSTVSDNLASASVRARAGGLGTYYVGSVILINTTISGNDSVGDSASQGGGIFVDAGGTMALYNSTVASNTSSGTGGGIYIKPPPTPLMPVVHGGVIPILVSTIVADNTATTAADIGAATPITLDGEHSLVEAAGANVTLPPDTLSGDPFLQPLRGNGGSTATRSLAVCSPAIDNGSNPLALLWDQRGEPFSRSWAADQDIGAFELQPNADIIFRDGFDPDPCSPP